MTYLSTAEVAQRLGVHTRTVARFVASDQLTPAAKAPGPRGAYLFDPDVVDEFATSRGARV